jgi:hypothetical protein
MGAIWGAARFLRKLPGIQIQARELIAAQGLSEAESADKRAALS